MVFSPVRTSLAPILPVSLAMFGVRQEEAARLALQRKYVVQDLRSLLHGGADKLVHAVGVLRSHWP